jgi:hypothetical protein
LIRALSTLLGTAIVLMLIVGVVLMIGTYTFLPPLVERAVARDVGERFETPVMPEVELESDPPPMMLAGEFSDGRVLLRDTRFGNVRARSTTLDLDPFDLRVLDSLTNGTPVGEGQLSGVLRAEIPEEEVSRLARAGSDVPVRDVELRTGRMLVRSSAPLFGVEAPVSVEVDPVLSDESLVFEPRRIEAFGSVLPGWLAQQMLAGTEFAYPLGGLPYGAEISGVEVREGSLVLSGEMESMPLDDPGG